MGAAMEMTPWEMIPTVTAWINNGKDNDENRRNNNGAHGNGNPPDGDGDPH